MMKEQCETNVQSCSMALEAVSRLNEFEAAQILEHINSAAVTRAQDQRTAQPNQRTAQPNQRTAQQTNVLLSQTNVLLSKPTYCSANVLLSQAKPTYCSAKPNQRTAQQTNVSVSSHGGQLSVSSHGGQLSPGWRRPAECFEPLEQHSSPSLPPRVLTIPEDQKKQC